MRPPFNRLKRDAQSSEGKLKKETKRNNKTIHCSGIVFAFDGIIILFLRFIFFLVAIQVIV